MKKAAAADRIRDKILETALKDVPFDGWTDKVMARAAQKAGVSPERLDDLFPRGLIDLIVHMGVWADDGMLKALPPAAKFDALRVRDKIALAVRTRFEFFAPHKKALAAAAAYMVVPPRSGNIPKIFWRTADAIWRRAGDRSTDYNHYTKRLLLSGVLSTTTFFWLRDDSRGSEKTWTFLARRIDNAMTAGKTVARLKTAATRPKKTEKKR